MREDDEGFLHPIQLYCTLDEAATKPLTCI